MRHTPQFMRALQKSYRYFPNDVAVVTITPRSRWQSFKNLFGSLCYEREWLGLIK
jgi:hypothetical protein